MAKKVSFGFSESFFLEKGYVSDGKGGWSPPPIKFDFIRGLKGQAAIEELTVKQKVNNSPQFDAKPVTEWFIPYQVPSKKNCQQLYVKKTKDGRAIPGTTTSQRYKDYVTATKMFWQTFGGEFKRTIERLKLNYPLQIEFTFIRSTQQEVDYVGPLESVQDIMQDFKWIPNDDYKHIKPALGDMEVDKNNPGVRIKLLLKQ